MSYYAVIDTNVLVSAMLKSVSMPGKLILEVLSGCIVPLYNTEIISEYREVLARKKFKFDPSMVNVLINTIIQRGVSVDACSTGIELIDPKDLIFYEVTMAKRKDGDAYLVTGNIYSYSARNV